jgi:hypothetical protein
MKRRLVKLLEPEVNLRSVLISHISASYYKIVKMRYTVVFLARLVHPVASLAFLFVLRAVILDVPLEVLTWKLFLLAHIASDEL